MCRAFELDLKAASAGLEVFNMTRYDITRNKYQHGRDDKARTQSHTTHDQIEAFTRHKETTAEIIGPISFSLFRS
jgi:hypothetical protein